MHNLDQVLKFQNFKRYMAKIDFFVSIAMLHFDFLNLTIWGLLTILGDGGLKDKV